MKATKQNGQRTDSISISFDFLITLRKLVVWFSYKTSAEFRSSIEPMMSKRDDFTCDLPELMPPARLLRVHQESGVTAEIDHAH